VTATMTWVGLDVHARSTHAAAIDRESGELTRARFGTGADPVVEWLLQLPQPVHACYEAGPTGYALYRAAVAAGLHVDGHVAPPDARRRSSESCCICAPEPLPVRRGRPSNSDERQDQTRGHHRHRLRLREARGCEQQAPLLREGRSWLYPDRLSLRGDRQSGFARLNRPGAPDRPTCSAHDGLREAERRNDLLRHSQLARCWVAAAYVYPYLDVCLRTRPWMRYSGMPGAPLSVNLVVVGRWSRSGGFGGVSRTKKTLTAIPLRGIDNAHPRGL
jgi:hypothetical protein